LSLLIAVIERDDKVVAPGSFTNNKAPGESELLLDEPGGEYFLIRVGSDTRPFKRLAREVLQDLVAPGMTDILDQCDLLEVVRSGRGEEAKGVTCTRLENDFSRAPILDPLVRCYDHVLLGDDHWIRGIPGTIARPRYGIRVDCHADISGSLAWRRWLRNLRLSHKRANPSPEGLLMMISPFADEVSEWA
jgi:hypothetical protein